MVFGRPARELEKAAAGAWGGAFGEIIVRTEPYMLIIPRVQVALILVFAAEQDGNVGKARYLIRRHLLGIQEVL